MAELAGQGLESLAVEVLAGQRGAVLLGQVRDRHVDQIAGLSALEHELGRKDRQTDLTSASS